MPICTCGGSQELTCQAIKNHLQGRAIPHLITAAMKTCRTLGMTVSPPRLNPRKKLRSSRRYFPSSPTSVAVVDEPDFLMSEGDGGVEDGDLGMECKEGLSVDDAGVQHAINAALEDVWSGLHHDDDDAVEEGDDKEDYEEGEDAEVNYAHDDWKMYDDLDVNENGLSALEMLGEDFERNVIAGGGFFHGSRIRISTNNTM